MSDGMMEGYRETRRANATMAFLNALADHVETPSSGTWERLSAASVAAASDGASMRIGRDTWTATLGDRVTELLEGDRIAWATLLHHLLTHDDASFWHGPGWRLRKASPFRDVDLLVTTLSAPGTLHGETAPVLLRAAAGAERIPTGSGAFLVPIARPAVTELGSGEDSAARRPGDPSPAGARAAAATLAHLGYTYAEGAERWKPPLGATVDFEEIDRRRALALALESGAVDKLSHEGVALVVAALREGRPRMAPQD